MNMEEEENAYTCLDTNPQEFNRERIHKGTTGSNKRTCGGIEICMCIWMQS